MARAGHPETWLRAGTETGRVALDPALGNLRELVFRWAGREMAPLHAAPWLGEALPEGLAPVEAALSGDFLCAPFGASDVEPAPIHGWPANSAWTPATAGGGTIAATLARPVRGARLHKRLTLAPDAPLLYQEHLIEGGAGGLTLAHHPMIHAAAGARLCTSPKRAALTPETEIEPGRGALRYPAEGRPEAFPGRDGPVDLTRLPIGRGTEDFVTLVESEGATLGWTAVLREAEDDIVLVLKDARVLPVTMLWHSNAGRDYAPWSGRHDRVLGIEDGIAAGAAGHAAALGPNPVVAHGVPTALPLAPGRRHRVLHVIGAVPRDGWDAVADILVEGDRLVLVSDRGARRELPFRVGLLG